MTSSEAIQDLVAKGTKKCWEEFEKLVVSLGKDEDCRSIRFDFEDEFEGFRVWCRNTGVFAEDRASLDYRVRDNAPTRKLLLTIFQGLASCLTQCKSYRKQSH